MQYECVHCSREVGRPTPTATMLAAELERCRICAAEPECCPICADDNDEMRPTSLFSLLCNKYVDSARTLMHEVLAVCTTEALIALAATDHWHRQQLRPQMLKLRQDHEEDCDMLACSLGCRHCSELKHLRAVCLTGLEPQPSRLQIDLPLTCACSALDRSRSQTGCP